MAFVKASSYLSIGHSNVTSCEGRDRNSFNFQAKIIKHENCQEISSNVISIGEPNINLERPLEKVLKKEEYIAIKCHNTPGDDDSGSYEIKLPYYVGGTPEEWLVWKDKLLKALDGQSISTGPLRYTFTERLLAGDAKATFTQAALGIGIRIIDNFNIEMTKHAFPAYAFG